MCNVNMCRAVTRYIICSYFLFGTYFLTQKWKVNILSPRLPQSSYLRMVQTPKKSIGVWLMCMMIVAKNIPQQNLYRRDSLEDEPRPGRPTDVISLEVIERAERRANDLKQVRQL